MNNRLGDGDTRVNGGLHKGAGSEEPGHHSSCEDTYCPTRGSIKTDFSLLVVVLSKLKNRCMSHKTERICLFVKKFSFIILIPEKRNLS